MARGGRRSDYRVTFAVLLAGTLAYALLQSAIAPILPTLGRDLNATQGTVTWLITGYLLVASVATPILGRIGDMVGKERILIVTLGAIVVGSAMSAVSTSIGMMLIARLLQGVGGGVLPLTFGIIRDEFPREKVAGAVGLCASMTAVGGGAGVVLAGPVTDSLGWHWLFWGPCVMAAIAALAAYLWVPESPVRTSGRVSWWAGVLLSGWLVALLVGVSQGNSWGWGSDRVLGLLIIAVVLAVAWIRVEHRSAEPLIDMQMMRLPAVWTTNLAALLIGVGMYASMAFLPAYLQSPRSTGYGFGLSITGASFLQLPMPVAMFIVGLATGALARRFGSKAVVVAGAFASTAGYGLLVLLPSRLWEMAGVTLLLGLGLGLAFTALTNLIVDAVPPSQTGVASGMNANIRTIGGSIGAAVMATIVTAGVGVGGFPSGRQYAMGYAFLAVTSLCGAAATLIIPTHRRAVVPDERPVHADLALAAPAAVGEGDA